MMILSISQFCRDIGRYVHCGHSQDYIQKDLMFQEEIVYMAMDLIFC